ncbi:MAG: hypothetical protein CSA49_07695 [Gammaproteobacteria bacterium]|nr:MAG: hypothetical protein CSA49_07695 [Gammaproteobacteria bacterium]
METSDTTTPESAASQSEVAVSQKQQKASKKSSPVPGILAVIAIIFALIALAGVGYLWNEARIEKARLVYENSSLHTELDIQRGQMKSIQDALAATRKELESAKSFVVSVQSDNDLVIGRVSAIEGQMAEVTGSNRVDWMLKEIEHFIMVAERRLSLLGDVDGALALMMEADQLVRDMSEPGARPLRNAIKKDLAALQAASDTSVDTEGLFAQISLLNAEVSGLMSTSINYEMSLPVKDVDQTLPKAGFEYFMYEVREFIKTLVRVQRVTDGEIKPLLLQDQQAFIEQNIQLLLEQAQLALLRGNQVVYTTSLTEAAKRVVNYLRTDTVAGAAFIASLKKLSQMNVQPEVPSIENSVRAVQVFRDYWQKEKVERLLGRAAIEAEISAQAGAQADPKADSSLPAAQ